MTGKFDAATLKGSLSRISQTSASAFAAAVVTRHVANYESFCRVAGPMPVVEYRKIVSRLWDAIGSQSFERSSWQPTHDHIMSCFPPETEEAWLYNALADDALASLAYAIRHVMSADPQEAVWSAQRAYDAVDQVTVAKLGISPGPAEAELAILSDPIVQRELGRQTRDLQLLGELNSPDGFAKLASLAWAEPMLTDEELKLVPIWQGGR